MTAMTAPLALFLTRFSAPPLPAPAVQVELPASKPTVTLLQSELDARLETAADVARADAERRFASEREAFVVAHEAALAEAVATARLEWAEAAGDHFATIIETQLAELRTTIADRLAHVLAPWLTEAARMRTIEALSDTLDRLLADPSKPAITICGPDDLIAAVRASRPAPGVEWIVTEAADVKITAGNTEIDTRLAAALTDIAATETQHVR